MLSLLLNNPSCTKNVLIVVRANESPCSSESWVFVSQATQNKYIKHMSIADRRNNIPGAKHAFIGTNAVH